MYLDLIGLEYWKSIVLPPSAKKASFFSAKNDPNLILKALLIASAVDLICCTFWVSNSFSSESVNSSRDNLSYAIISSSTAGFSFSKSSLARSSNLSSLWSISGVSWVSIISSLELDSSSMASEESTWSSTTRTSFWSDTLSILSGSVSFPLDKGFLTDSLVLLFFLFFVFDDFTVGSLFSDDLILSSFDSNIYTMFKVPK